MKNLFLLLFLFFWAITSKAQIGIGTTSPNSTLDVRGSVSAKYTSFSGSTTAAATDNMLVFTGTSAATLTVPDATTCTGRYYWIKNTSSNSSTLTIATTSSQTIDGLASWTLTQTNKAIRLVSDGTNWIVVSESLPGNSAGTAWILGGNNVVSLQNIGTTSNYALPFITNNTEKMRLTTGGSLGIGTSTFNATYIEKLLVDAGATGNTNYQNVIVGKGNTNSYAQLNIQNNNAGTTASSDVVATADNGNETVNYIDMGMNSSANTTTGPLGGANTAYLYSTGNDFAIGNGTSAKNLTFFTTTGGTYTERMRIDGSGNVGIGLTNPSYKLHINGVNPLFLNGVQTGANTDSILTIINGVVKKLSPSALTTSSSNAWALIGNSGTSSSSNFLGTTDAQALVIKENSTQVGRFEANSIAFGNGATTNNATNSYALGSSATISFNKANSFAIGNSASVTDNSSFAIGNSAVTNGSNSLALGNSSAANNTNSVAIGYNAVTAYSISNALAAGSSATANSSNAIAIGPSAITGFNLTNPLSIGNSAVANGNNSVALGSTATVGFVDNSTAIGALTSVTGNNSTAIGYNTTVTKSNAVILGDRSNTGVSVGIGTENFSGSNREKLLVDAGASGSTAYQNVVVGKGNTNSYAQLNIQNGNAGTSASTDVVATADNGSETVNYIDMGINSSANTSAGVLGGANTAYLYTTGNDFAIGNGTNSKNLNFFTTTGGTYTERMRILSSGNVGIANVAPTEKLDVTGNVRFSGALMPNNLPGTAGYVLVSSGAGVAPTWADASGYINNLAWLQGGNTFSSVQNFGTISNHDIPIITNNTEKMRITAAGTVGIGTSTFSGTNPEELIVNAGSTGNTNYQNVIVGKGNTNSYAQLNIQNGNAGTTASSDVVATANNGSETVNFIDMGINSGSNTTAGVLGGANTAYLYSTGNDFVIGNSTESKDIIFYTTVPVATSTERMRVTGTGVKVSGSLTVAFRSGTGNYTLLTTDYVVINTGAAATWTLPAANTCAGKVYRLLNHGTANITLSIAITKDNATTTTTLPFAAGTNYTEIISDGATWRMLN